MTEKLGNAVFIRADLKKTELYRKYRVGISLLIVWIGEIDLPESLHFTGREFIIVRTIYHEE